MSDFHDGTGATGRRSTRKRHPRGVAKDNVIYYNFGKTTSTPPPAPTREDRRQSREASKSVPNLLRSYVQDNTDSGRYSRGQKYYRDGHVVDFVMDDGVITADVLGSQADAFTVSVHLPYRGDEQREEIRSYLRTYPSTVRKAREGLLTDELADLVWKTKRESHNARCDCPDMAPVCKHIVAVVLKAADSIAHDPRIIFDLRGVRLDELEVVRDTGGRATSEGIAPGQGSSVEQKAKAPERETTSWTQDEFWQGAALPVLPNPKVAPALEDSDQQLLQKAMAEVSYATIETLRAVAEIEDLYYELTHLED